MKKTKKLLSLLTALTITASAFAGLAIPANAAETQIGSTYTFDETSDTAWTLSGTHKAQFTSAIVEDTTLKSKVLSLTGRHGGGRTAAVDLPAAITPSGTDPVKLEFDWYSMTSGSVSSMDVIPSDASSKQIFKLTEAAAGTIAVNDTVAEGLERGWYKVCAVLDFETHRVIELTLTANGSDTPAVTKEDIPFIDNTASGVGNFGLIFNRGPKDTADVDIRLDNVAAYTVTDTYYKVEMNIKDSKGAAVEGAAVKLGDTEYTTGADGKVTTKLANGSYDYEVSKIGFVDGDGNDKATGTIAVNGAAATENVTYSLKPYTPTVTTATISGGQKVLYAPTGNTPATSAAFTVAVKDQNETAMEAGYTTAWAVYPTGTTTADANVTIANGIVSVTKDFTAASGVAGVYDVIATVTDAADDTKTAEAKATITVTNNDVVFYDAETAYIANEKKAKEYDIEDVSIPAGGLRITFDYEKGAYDSTKDDRYGQLAFKNGTTTLFYMKDMNAGLTLYTDDTHSVSLGSTERNVQYPVDITIIGSQLLINFNNDDGYKVVEFASAPDKITALETNSNQDNGSNTGARNLIMSTKVTVDKNDVSIIGDDNFAKIAGKTVTREYTAKALVPETGDNFTWTVTQATGVSIDSATGVLSVDDTAAAGKVTVTATSGTKTGSMEVTIADVQEYIPEVDVPSAMETGETYNLSVGKIVDALGDDVTEYLNPTWLIDDVPSLDTNVTFNTTGKTGDAVAISAVKEDGVLKSVSSQDVTITGDSTVVTAESGSTVMLWDSLEGMKPLAAPQTAPDVTIGEDVSAAVGAKSGILRTYIDGDVTLNLVLTESADPIQYRITVAKYAKVVDYTAGMTTVPVSDLVVSDYITGYKVTVADAHGSQLGQQVVAIADVADDNVALPAINVDVVPEKVEVAPVFKLTEDLTDIYAAPAVLEVPNNTYDIDFEKVTEGRVDMKVNGYIVVENAGMGGTGRGVSGTRTYSADNVIVNKGKAVISGDGACELASVTICKTPEIVNRKTHLWIAGDSTVCVYYGNEETGDVKDLQTGWGQVFDTYINKDEATVVDLAESGSYIHRWFYEEYPTVRDMAQPGDYFIVQMGINDRSHGDVTDEADMKALLGQMVDEMRARGVIPVLVTPQKSKGYAWYSADASKGDITKWDGAGIAWSSYGFGTGAMKAVAEDKGTLFVDSASMSAKAFFDLGADYVIDNFHLSNEHASGKEMHFSYAGAQKLASMIAQSIYDQTKAGKTTSKGEKFDGIPVITTGSGFTFTDSTGASQTYNVVDSAN